MMRSLFAGVAGLKTHQIKMDVIGNNIANVNTVGYKSQSINFAELMYQTTQSASGPNADTGRAGTNAKQIGLGTVSAAITTIMSAQGSSLNTGNAFDLRICVMFWTVYRIEFSTHIRSGTDPRFQILFSGIVKIFSVIVLGFILAPRYILIIEMRINISRISRRIWYGSDIA